MRGGSKGVMNKNSRKLLGKPLMSYTIDQALNSGLFSHLVVSTDSKEIADKAENLGAEILFLRPAELATDSAPKIPVIRHALLEVEKHYSQQYEVLVDLDATSPLRKSEDIIKAYEQFINDNAEILITGNPARKNPYFNMIENIDGQIQISKKLEQALLRRQDAPKVFEMNASIYIWSRKALLDYDTLFTKKTSLYIMPEDRSIDIDTDFDWDFVEYLMKKKKEYDD
jgi:CMP-N,N'-diacetyllegionaminic acid synthase